MTMSQRLADVDAAQRAGMETTPRARTVLDSIRGRQQMYAAVLNRTIDPERFTRVALASVGRNADLMQCTEQSLLSALMLSAQLGLEPGGPLGHAYLVPYKREATFIVGYRGYLELARRSGQIASMYAEAVFEGDEFTWQLGLDRTIVHRPLADDRTDATKVTHVYAVAKLRDADADPIFVVLNRGQIESYRKRSKAKDRGPWVTDPIPMMLKTAVRRLSTWLPLSVEMAAAAEHDERTITRVDAHLDTLLTDDADTIDVDAVDTEALEAGETAADPIAQAHVDAMAEAQARVEPPTVTDLEPVVVTHGDVRAQVLELLPEVKTSHDWPKFLRRTGLSSNPERWTFDQFSLVLDWITAERTE